MSEPSRGDARWQQSLSELCTSHGALLYRLAFGVLRDAHAAEDVCQEALARACARDERPPDAARLRGWLAKVVVNESLARLRRHKVELRARARLIPAARSADDPPVATPTPDPELRAAVLAALATLPEPVRVVVLLRVMQGLSGNEVKDLLGCSAAEVSRRLYQGMELLRGLLADKAGAANGPGATVEDDRHGS